MRSNNNLNNTIAYKKIKHFCAYQERCHSEVKTKLINLGVYGNQIDEIIAHLIVENYLNESRFAELYARGKHNLKYWGKQKIKQRLIQKKVSANIIKSAINSIDEKVYIANLKKLLFKRLNNNFDFESEQKAIRFCMAKGYKYAIVKQLIELLKNEAK